MITKVLIEAKKAKGMTNENIAEESGVPIGTVARVFAGQADDLRMSTAIPLAKVLGVSIDKFMGIDHEVVHEVIHEIETPARPSREASDLDWVKKLVERELNKERREKRILFACLMAVVTIVLIMFMVDIFSGDMGWIRYGLFRHAQEMIQGLL